jgi:hypothetical protein
MNSFKYYSFVGLLLWVFLFPCSAVAENKRLDIDKLRETTDLENLEAYLKESGFYRGVLYYNKKPDDSITRYEKLQRTCVDIKYSPKSLKVSSVSYYWPYFTDEKDEFSNEVSKKSFSSYTDEYIKMCRDYYMNVYKKVQSKYGEPISIRIVSHPKPNNIGYIKDKAIIDTLDISRYVCTNGNFIVFWKNAEGIVTLSFSKYASYDEAFIEFTYHNYENEKIRGEEIESVETKQLLKKIALWSLVVLIGIFIIFAIVKTIYDKIKADEEESRINRLEIEKRLELERKEIEEKKKQRQLQLEVIKTEHNNYVSKLVGKYGTRDKVIKISTKNPDEIFEIMVFSESKHVVIGKKELSFKDIIDCTVNDNAKETETVQTFKGDSIASTKTNTGSMIGRTVAGGLLLGDVGAIIGGSTASKQTVIQHGTDTSIHNKTVEHDYTIAITVKDIANPVIYINVGSNAKLKDEISSLMKVIISMK